MMNYYTHTCVCVRVRVWIDAEYSLEALHLHDFVHYTDTLLGACLIT